MFWSQENAAEVLFLLCVIDINWKPLWFSLAGEKGRERKENNRDNAAIEGFPILTAAASGQDFFPRKQIIFTILCIFLIPGFVLITRPQRG